jgi:transformation/transcription domain-associated protein
MITRHVLEHFRGQTRAFRERQNTLRAACPALCSPSRLSVRVLVLYPPPAMDPTPHSGSASNIQSHLARVADTSLGMHDHCCRACSAGSLCGTDLKTRHAAACELRDQLDTAKDDALRVYSTLIPAFTNILRQSEAAFDRNSIEFQFRRNLLDILGRVSFSEPLRPQAAILVGTCLHLLRHDNEENAVLCCKTLIEINRNLKSTTDETVQDLVNTFSDLCRNMPGAVTEYLSDDSQIVKPETSLPSIRSFKVLAEIGAVLVTIAQFNRAVVEGALMGLVSTNFQVLSLESPTQKKARESLEATGGIWAGVAPNLKNPTIYADFIHAQCKVCSTVQS